jgi:hypothetical protein
MDSHERRGKHVCDEYPQRPNVLLVGNTEPIVYGYVSDARGVFFGNERALYADLSDIYFSATLSNDLNSMSGGPCHGPCTSMTAVRRL